MKRRTVNAADKIFLAVC